MPLAAHSLASSLVSPATPDLGGGVARHADAALEAQHRGDVDDLAAALRDHVPRRRPGTGRRRDLRLVSITASQSSSVKSTASARRMMPALLTRMSSPPSSVERLVDHRPGPARWSTGRRAIERGPAAGAADQLARSRRRGERPTSATSAPASASATRDPLADAGIGAGDDRDLAGEIEQGRSSIAAGRCRGRSCRYSPGSRRPSPR